MDTTNLSVPLSSPSSLSSKTDSLSFTYTSTKSYRQRAAHIRQLKINKTPSSSIIIHHNNINNSNQNSIRKTEMKLRHSHSSVSLATTTTTPSPIKKQHMKKSSSFSSYRYEPLHDSPSVDFVHAENLVSSLSSSFTSRIEQQQQQQQEKEKEDGIGCDKLLLEDTHSITSIPVLSSSSSLSSNHPPTDIHTPHPNTDWNCISSTQPSSSSKCTKHVSFHNIYIRCYNQIVGDHPCCVSGPPLALGWSYTSTLTMDVESYEIQYRGKEHPRRYGRELKLDDTERRDILLRHPCSSNCLHALEQDTMVVSRHQQQHHHHHHQQQQEEEGIRHEREGIMKKRYDIDEKWLGIARHASVVVCMDKTQQQQQHEEEEEEEDNHEEGDEKKTVDPERNNTYGSTTTPCIDYTPTLEEEQEEDTSKTTRVRLRQDRVMFFNSLSSSTAQQQQQKVEEEQEQNEEIVGYSEAEMKRLERKLYRQRCTRSRWQSDFFDSDHDGTTNMEENSHKTKNHCECGGGSSSNSESSSSSEDDDVRNNNEKMN